MKNMNTPQSYSSVDAAGIAFDLKIDALFGQKTGGVYIEIGGNDGITQSNTAYLEFTRGWTGILIEPSVTAYHKCILNRPGSQCFNTACVAPNFESSSLEGDFFGHLMSSVDGKRLGTAEVVTVPACTLESILRSEGITDIDFLSLDTEGYELNVLQGMNLSVFRPRFILVEVYTWDYDSIVEYLKNNGYQLRENFSNYTPVTNPHWDGTHNDYLFEDITK